LGIHGPVTASEGIDHYYIRYDIKSGKNKITEERLTMVPANNDFRVEDFSLSQVSNVISAGPGDSKQAIDTLAKEHALKTILEQKGLRSVKTQNHETIVSYEGMIITPVSLAVSAYDDILGGYKYTARIHFAPIAFPDQWETLKIKHRIKEFFHDFFLLFK
jgi:hypothetical protein